MPGKYKEIEPELIWALYWGLDYSTTKLQNIFNCSNSTICGKMDRYNIPRRSISESRKGFPSKFKGLTKETSRRCKSISEKLIGHSVSKETRKKISLSNRGKNIGINNGNWNGGSTSLYMLIRRCSYMKKWRNKIFHRDNYTCQKCNNKCSGHLNAHHIIEFKKILDKNNINNFTKAKDCEELWDISNGITLCEKCHKEIHYVK